MEYSGLPTELVQRVGFLTIVPRLLRNFGADPPAVLAAAGLNAQALDDPDAMIPYAAMGRLLDIAVRTTRCAHFGLLIGQSIGTASLGLIGELMRHAPTLRIALQDLATHQHRHAHGAVVYLLERDDDAFLGYAIYQPGIGAKPEIYDGAAAAAFNLVGELIPPNRRHGRDVWLSRAAPADRAPYRRFFGANPHFDADETGVSLPRTWLDQPVPGADAALRKPLEEQVAAYWRAGDLDIMAQVRRAIRTGLLRGEFSGQQIAARLGIPRRTLHRKLESHGIGFQGILNETRFEFAQHLLANTRLTASDVAAIVRYTDPAAFTRAFTYWAGQPPGAWRLNQRGAPDPSCA